MRSSLIHNIAIALAALSSIAVFTAAQSSQPGSRPATPVKIPPYKDLSLSFEDRAHDLVKRMTLSEKCEQVLMAVPPNNRLGIPAMQWWSEALHGVSRAGTATIFPQALGLAATFNPALIHDVAAATADEARAKYDPAGSRYRGITLWCPTVNMARDPRWGRVEETFGEDPFLASRIGVAFVKGLQGDDPKYIKTVATPKHFAVHSEENGRMYKRNEVAEEVIRDYYFPAFQACFVEGGALSSMAAHTGINKIPCHANRWLLTDVLRDEWHFNGAVVSDWTGVSQLFQGQRYVNGEDEAIAAALNAGLDVICDPRPYAASVERTVTSGLLKEEVLDLALYRNLLVRFRLGMFDPPSKVPFANTPASEVGSRPHMLLALQSAREATVLLKNDPAPRGYGFDKLLPLDLRKIDSIAIIGPYANLRQYGAYSANSPANTSPTILEAMRTALTGGGERIQINTADWADPEGTVRAAEKSTIALVVMGLSSNIEKEGIDRQTIEMPIDQRIWLEKIIHANPLTILVLEGCGPIGMEWANEHVPAILDIWYPGEQGAVALAEILTGQYNPAGRLPLTFHRTIADLPPLDDYDIRNGRTYMYATKPVTYPFGHGLSYTTFTYANLKAPTTATATDSIKISLDITNTGSQDGDEVLQLYTRELNAPKEAQRPIKQLKAFQRATIRKGATQTITLQLPIASLGMWNPEAHAYTVTPGPYELQLGPSSANILQRATITITN